MTTTPGAGEPASTWVTTGGIPAFTCVGAGGILMDTDMEITGAIHTGIIPITDGDILITVTEATGADTVTDTGTVSMPVQITITATITTPTTMVRADQA